MCTVLLPPAVNQVAVNNNNNNNNNNVARRPPISKYLSVHVFQCLREYFCPFILFAWEKMKIKFINTGTILCK
jgi:hypothetical protein